jgi:hypothetical protein
MAVAVHSDRESVVPPTWADGEWARPGGGTKSRPALHNFRTWGSGTLGLRQWAYHHKQRGGAQKKFG